jgi:hypothetical protein
MCEQYIVSSYVVYYVTWWAALAAGGQSVEPIVAQAVAVWCSAWASQSHIDN